MGSDGSPEDDVHRRYSVAHEASDWLAVLTDASCTDEERQSFVAWLRRSNLHVEEFLLISMLTQRLTRPELWPAADIQELVAQAIGGATNNVRYLPHPSTSRARPASTTRWMRWALAACAVPITVILALVIARLEPFGWAGTRYFTAIGELRSITLEDGSVMQLNSGSSARAHFTDAERSIELLRGEAIFKVAQNAHRPFRVYTKSTEITAVGTQFNVYARSSRTVVTVLEGRVRVTDQGADGSAAATPIELAPNEQVVIAPNQPPARRRIADSRPVTAWTERRLIFEDTPLSTAAAEFALYNRRRIHVPDPQLAQLRITGVFDATDPASLVQFVEAYAGVASRREDDGWTLIGSGVVTP